MDITEYALAILALAVWRISSLLAQERGPKGLFDWIREKAGVQYIGDEVVGPEIAKLITCVWCNSIWVGAIASISYYLSETLTVWLALPFALSAAAIIISSIVGRE